MPLTRHHLFAGLGTLVFTSCAPEPVVDNPIASPKPSQDPGVSTLSAAVTELSGAVSRQSDLWRVAALAQTSAWQRRLLATDPLVGGEPVFPETSFSPSVSQSSDPGIGLTAATQPVMGATAKALKET